MKSILKNFFRKNRRALALAMFLFLTVAAPLTGYFVLNRDNFDERGMAYWEAFDKYDGFREFYTEHQQWAANAEKEADAAIEKLTRGDNSSSKSGGGSSSSSGSGTKVSEESKNPASTDLEREIQMLQSKVDKNIATPDDLVRLAEIKERQMLQSKVDKKIATADDRAKLGALKEKETLQSKVDRGTATADDVARLNSISPGSVKNDGSKQSTSTDLERERQMLQEKVNKGIATVDDRAKLGVIKEKENLQIKVDRGTATTDDVVRLNHLSNQSLSEIGADSTPPVGDITGDGKVGIKDYAVFKIDFVDFKQNGWSAGLRRSDLDGDGVVSIRDYTIFVNSYRFEKGF